MSKFYEKYKEWFDQTAHFLMGFGASCPLAYFFWPLGIISAVVWRVREWYQHKGHDHEPRWIFSRDLFFIDSGAVIGMAIWV